MSWCEERQNPWVCNNSQSILCTYETDPLLNCWSTRRCFSSVYRVVYAVSLICYTPDRELYGSVMQAEFLFCLRYVSLSEWFHWNSVRDGEVGAEEDNGPPRLSYQPMRKKSNGSVSTHKTYGIILRERIGSPSVHPRSSVHPPPPSYTTNPHYHSPQSFLPLIM